MKRWQKSFGRTEMPSVSIFNMPRTTRRARKATAAITWALVRGKGNIKTGEAIEVIEIVPSTRGALFERQPRGSIYVPFARGFQTAAYFFVQCPSLRKENAAEMSDAVRRAVREIDPTLPVISLKAFSQHG